jgi:hypothetical protein
VEPRKKCGITFTVILEYNVQGLAMKSPEQFYYATSKTVMQLDHSKVMPVYVSNCTSYDFNALTSFV